MHTYIRIPLCDSFTRACSRLSIPQLSYRRIGKIVQLIVEIRNRGKNNLIRYCISICLNEIRRLHRATGKIRERQCGSTTGLDRTLHAICSVSCFRKIRSRIIPFDIVIKHVCKLITILCYHYRRDECVRSSRRVIAINDMRMEQRDTKLSYSLSSSIEYLKCFTYQVARELYMKRIVRIPLPFFVPILLIFALDL